MKILVLDPRSGDSCADLFVVDFASGASDRLRLGYVPEVHYDAAAGELAVVDTELPQTSGVPARYWLKCYDLGTLRQTRRHETPMRPMYAGFPGRSTRLVSSSSGRYLYFLQSEGIRRYPEEDIFRLRVHRYDRRHDAIELGDLVVDSCLLDFGPLGGSEDELFLHLSCDFPSTIAFGKFPAPGLTLLRLEDLPSRSHSPRETCGSWLARESGTLYCVTGEGKIYRVRHAEEPALLLELPLTPPRSVPLHHLYGGGGRLFVGVAADDNERSLGLASEIWQVSLSHGTVASVTKLPLPVMNFVTTPDGATLIGVNPYATTLYLMDLGSGKPLKLMDDLGVSPAEVLLVP